MGANFNANKKMSRRQMRLCQALKLVPVYPVTPHAMEPIDDYDSGIERTSPPTIYFQNQAMTEEVVATTTNRREATEDMTLHKSELLNIKVKEEMLDEAEESEHQVEDDSIENSVSERDSLTPTTSAEMDMYAEEFDYEAEIDTSYELKSNNDLQTMFLSCGARQQGFDRDSLVHNNGSTSFNALRIKKLEIWEQEKLQAIFEIEQKLKELISIKGKVKRLKKSKKKLLQLKHKQEEIIRRVREYKIAEKYRRLDELKSQQSQVIKTEIEDINYDLVETFSPASPAPSSSAASTQGSASPSTTVATTPYHKFNKFQLNASSTPLKRCDELKLDTFKTIDFKTMPCDKYDLLTIGPNGTKVAKAALQNINWSLSGAAVTRKILMEVFDRETLAFHTLTGKPSPAFLDCDKPMKGQLDPLKVADIIHIVTQHLKLTEKEVRQAITTKCADENKMFRQRERKRINLEQEE